MIFTKFYVIRGFIEHTEHTRNEAKKNVSSVYYFAFIIVHSISSIFILDLQFTDTNETKKNKNNNSNCGDGSIKNRNVHKWH